LQINLLNIIVFLELIAGFENQNTLDTAS
jgi:hypothetical protein